MTLHIEDPIGQKTLESFSKTKKFNSWQYKAIAHYCKGSILEIGSGIGNISDFLLENNTSVTLSDLRKNYCTILQERFRNRTSLRNIIQLDLGATDFDNKYTYLLGQFDTIIALNVIEHIQNDANAINNCRKLLRPEGQIIILVPAYQCLYNSLDKGLDHFKRYTRKSLTKLVMEQGMEIKVIKHFNFVGILGWWFSGTLLKKKMIPKKQISIYDKLVPLFRIADHITLNKIGLSVISVAQKSNKNYESGNRK